MNRARHCARAFAEALEGRLLLAGTLLSDDFNGAATWPQTPGVTTSGVTATVVKGAVGTIDTASVVDTSTGTTTSSSGPTDGYVLTVTAAPGGTWSTELASGPLTPTTANDISNLGLLTFAFQLSTSVARPVEVHIDSYNAANVRTGGLETLVYPAVANSFQRFAVDLSTMTASGSGTFVPLSPKFSFSFEIGSAAGWTTSETCQLRVDNIHFAKPAFYVAPGGSDATATGRGLSEAMPYATPSKAVSVAQAGDIVVVKAGTYTTSGTNTDGSINSTGAIKFGRPGTPAAWITLKNYPGQSPLLSNKWWNCILVGNPGTSTNPTPATTAAVAYIEVRGMHIKGNADTLNQNSPGINQAVPETNNNGISVDGRYQANHPHDIRFADNFVEYCSGGGIGGQALDRIQIENNVVQNNCHWMIYAGSGISVFSAYQFDSADSTVYTRFIRNNIVSGNECYEKWAAQNKYSDGNGIIVDLNHDDAYVPGYTLKTRTLVQNNVAFNNGGSGMHSTGANHVDFFNNTSYKNSASPYLVYPPIFSSGVGTDIRIYNNIMVAPNYTSGVAADKESVVAGNNSYYRNNVYFGGDITPTIIAGSGNIIGDPKFVAASIDPAIANFRVNSDSPAINLGQAALAPLFDATLATRYSNPDSGAYEFIPSAPATVTLSAGSDTGVAGDSRTNLNNDDAASKLTFNVTGVLTNSLVQLYAGTTLIGSALGNAAGTSITTAGTAAALLADGSYAVTVKQTFAGAPSPTTGMTAALVIDTVAPVVSAGTFDFETRQAIRFTFGEAVLIAGGSAGISVKPVGGSAISAALTATASVGGGVSYDLTFPGLSNSRLPDGRYTAQLLAGGFTDAAGNAASISTVVPAFDVLDADANGDDTVDTLDFARLVASFGLTGRTFSTGNFDLSSDGVVNSIDFGRLVTQYGKALPAAAALPASRSARPIFSDSDGKGWLDDVFA